MEKALTGFNKHNIRFVKLKYNMDNMDYKSYTGKSFSSVHISDMHEIPMYSNTGYYNILAFRSRLWQFFYVLTVSYIRFFAFVFFSFIFSMFFDSS